MKTNLIYIFLMLLGSLQNMEAADGEKVNCRSVLLSVGDQYWMLYKCKNCQQIASARPVRGRQQCQKCGRAHSDEEWIDLPTEDVRIGNNTVIRLFVPEALINPKEEGAEFAKTGALQKCVFCGSSNFSNQHQCLGCGATYENKYESRSVDGFSLEPSEENAPPRKASSSSASRPELENNFRSRRISDAYQMYKPRSFGLLTKAGVTIAAIGTAVGLWMHGRSPYILEGEVTQISPTPAGLVAKVSYQDKKGKPQEASVLVDVPKLEEGVAQNRDTSVLPGEKVELHFRNWFGLYGGESLSGTLLKPNAP